MTINYLTKEPLLGDLLKAAQRNYLSGEQLCAWAEALLNQGIESPSIIDALVSNDLHWQQVPILFSQMCIDLGVCEDPYAAIEQIRQHICIEEYCAGLRSGSSLLHDFDYLRIAIGFPYMITLKIVPDNTDGTNDSGFYGMNSHLSHDVLEQEVVAALRTFGIESNAGK